MDTQPLHSVSAARPRLGHRIKGEVQAMVGFSVRTRHQKHDLEWKPKVGTNAPTRAEEVPTRFRRLKLRRRRKRSGAETMSDTTMSDTMILIVVVVLFATLVLGWQVLAR